MSAAGTGIDPEMASKIKLPGLSLKTIATATNSAAVVSGGSKARPVLPTSKSHQERRGMASNSGGAVKTDWLVILPDSEGVLEKRMGVRAQHLKEVMPSMESGFWRVGGATLDEPFKDGEPPKINGSMMIARATSKEEVVEELKKDVYTTAGIWDWNKVQIMPFKAAFYKGNED